MNKFDVQGQDQLNTKIVDLLKSMQDSNYLLMLSGGKSIIKLYEFLAGNFDFPFPKDLCMVDERWGEKNHENSNEFILKESGLLGRIYWEKSGFYPIIQPDTTSYITAAETYQRYLVEKLEKYTNRVVAVMGMGQDGHTAGVLPDSIGALATELVVGYESSDYGARISISLNCISEFVNKVFLILDSPEEITLFEDVISQETPDVSTYPVGIYKKTPDLNVINLAGTQ